MAIFCGLLCPLCLNRGIQALSLGLGEFDEARVGLLLQLGEEKTASLKRGGQGTAPTRRMKALHEGLGDDRRLGGPSHQLQGQIRPPRRAFFL